MAKPRVETSEETEKQTPRLDGWKSSEDPYEGRVIDCEDGNCICGDCK